MLQVFHVSHDYLLIHVEDGHQVRTKMRDVESSARAVETLVVETRRVVPPVNGTSAITRNGKPLAGEVSVVDSLLAGCEGCASTGSCVCLAQAISNMGSVSAKKINATEIVGLVIGLPLTRILFA